MITKQIYVDSHCEFGDQVAASEREKDQVAKEVVSKVLLFDEQNPANPVFISDGSSASSVWCHYMKEWAKRYPKENLRVWTNNCDVTLQTLIHQPSRNCISVHVASGRFRRDYCAVFGEDTEKWCLAHSSRSVCVVAVTALDHELGPCARNEDARAIKSAVMRSAQVLVIIADRDKLRQQRNPGMAANAKEWENWINNQQNRLFVVTTRSPHINPALPDNSLRGADAIEQENLRLLRLKLKEHFICIPPIPRDSV